MWVGGELHSTWNIVKLFEESKCPLHGDILRCPALSPGRRGGIAPVIVLPHWHVYVFICILLGPYGSTVFNTFRCHQAVTWHLSSSLNLPDPPASWCFSLSWQPWLQCQPMRCRKQECFVESQVFQVSAFFVVPCYDFKLYFQFLNHGRNLDLVKSSTIGCVSKCR